MEHISYKVGKRILKYLQLYILSDFFRASVQLAVGMPVLETKS
jgi:hypothetical protein